MNTTMRARTGGKHRKRCVSTATKGRATVVALATGAASVVTAAAASAHEDSTHGTQVQEDASVANGDTSTTGGTADSAPQILAVADFRPTVDLGQQLSAALQFTEQRLAADRAARAPQVARPAEGTFTSGFGMRWGSMHSGIDIANAIGTPIVAVMDGTVIDSGPASGYGQWIRIRHDDGAVSVYGHMETLNVTVGELVTAGQLIAGMGSRGFSTGSHLHFEIHPDGTTPVDPQAWLAERGITV